MYVLYLKLQQQIIKQEISGDAKFTILATPMRPWKPKVNLSLALRRVANDDIESLKYFHSYNGKELHGREGKRDIR